VLDLEVDPFASGEETGVNELGRLLRGAALVTVATPAIARQLGAHGVDCLLVPDAVDERLLYAGTSPPRKTSSEGASLRVLSIPGDRAWTDGLAPALERLRSEGDAVIELHAPPFRGPDAEAGDYVARMQWLRDHCHEFDAAALPVGTSPADQSRSDLPFLECAALGLPAVVSDREPYSTITDGALALKVGDDPDHWCAALRRLADDPALRATLAGAAADYVREHRLARDAAEPFLAALFDLVCEGRRSDSPDAPELQLTSASG
jgi:hypothetical protein